MNRSQIARRSATRSSWLQHLVSSRPGPLSIAKNTCVSLSAATACRRHIVGIARADTDDVDPRAVTQASMRHRSSTCRYLPYSKVCGTAGIDILRVRLLTFEAQRLDEGVDDDRSDEADAPTREEFVGALAEGLGQEVLRARSSTSTGTLHSTRTSSSCRRRRVSLYGTPLWDDMTRAQQIELVAPGVRQHALGGHLVREHPQPGLAAQDDASGSRPRAPRTTS